MSNSVYLTNLPCNYTNGDLRTLFQHIGGIKAAYIKPNESKSAASGYVQFTSPRHAKHAASRHHKMGISGHEVAVYLVWSSSDTLSTIKVSNIAPNSSRTSIRSICTTYGDIIDIKLKKTRANPTAMVTYSRVSDAVFAQREMNGLIVGDNGTLHVSLIDNDARNLKYRHNITIKRVPIQTMQEIINSDYRDNKSGYDRKQNEYDMNIPFKSNHTMCYDKAQRYEHHHTYIHSHHEQQQQQQRPLTTNTTNTTGTTPVNITYNTYNPSGGVYRTSYFMQAPTTMNYAHSVQSHSNSAQPIYPTPVPSTYLYSTQLNQTIMDINMLNAQVYSLKAAIDARLNGINTMNVSSTSQPSQSISQSDVTSQTQSPLNASSNASYMIGHGTGMNVFGAQYGNNRS